MVSANGFYENLRGCGRGKGRGGQGDLRRAEGTGGARDTAHTHGNGSELSTSSSFVVFSPEDKSKTAFTDFSLEAGNMAYYWQELGCLQSQGRNMLSLSR